MAYLKDQLSGEFAYRRMIEIVKANESSEFLSYFPEMTPLYTEVKGKFDGLVAELDECYSQIKNIKIQKDFALLAIKTRMSGALFAVRSGSAGSVRASLSGCTVKSLERVLGME